MWTLTKFCDLKIFTKTWRLFKILTIFLSMSATLSNICDKSYYKTYRFVYIFSNFHLSFTCLQNFMISNIFRKKCLFQYVDKSLHIPATLNNIFHKIMKNPYIFVTCFSSSFQYLHCHTVLLRPHFYHKNGSFNVANKLLLISKSMFFTPCF